MANKIQRGTSSNLIQDDKLKINTQLSIPVKDIFTDDEIASQALGNTNRIKIKGIDSNIREIANLEDLDPLIDSIEDTNNLAITANNAAISADTKATNALENAEDAYNEAISKIPLIEKGVPGGVSTYEQTENALIEANNKIPLIQKDAVGGVPNINTVSLVTTRALLKANASTLKSNLFSTTDSIGDWYYDSSDTTSLDNGGTIIVDAANRRFKRIFDGYIKLQWWDYLVTSRPTADKSTWDWTPAVNALNIFIARNIAKFAASIGDPFNLANGTITVLFDGIFGFSNTLIIYPGASYVIPAGSRLYAISAGQIISRSPTGAELNAAGTGPIYGARNISLTGKGVIDGANLASVGFLADTVAKEGVVDITVTRCTYRKYVTTVTGTTSSAVVVVGSSNNFRVNDVVFIEGTDREFYSVRSINGVNITLNRNLDTSVTGSTLTHRAVGVSGHMAQQSRFTIMALYNDIGVFFGYNTEAVASTDMKLSGMLESNMVGEVILDSDVKHYNCTIQHNFGTEIYSIGGTGGLWDSIYLESMSDVQANGLIPPIGGAPITSAVLGTYPLIQCKGGRSTFKNINYPTNPINTSWRRFMMNTGDTLVDGIVFGSVALLVNPSIAGDYGLVEQSASTGYIFLRNVRGLTNLTTVGPFLVCKADGTAPNANQASWEYPLNSNWSKVFTTSRWTTWLTTSVLDIYRRGEAFSRLSFLPGSIAFGNGVNSTTIPLALGSVAGTLSIGGSNNFIARRVSPPTLPTTSGLPGDFAIGSKIFYFYAGDGTTHSWFKIDASIVNDQGNFTIDATTSPYTTATLNSTYPNAKKGNIIIQDGANRLYIKKDDSVTGNWSIISYTTIIDAIPTDGSNNAVSSNGTFDALALKQNQLSGTGFIKASGTTISYDNTTYYPSTNPSGYTNNLGTVTNVSSTNTDIGISNPSTTPVLTLNSGLGANQIVKRDASGNITATSFNGTSTNSSQWSGQSLTTGPGTTTPSSIMGYLSASNLWAPVDATRVSLFLGLGPAAYLFVDATPTNSSSNTVTSGGVFSALSTKQNTLSVTTTGSGAATLISNTLNIPTPAIPTNYMTTNTNQIGLSGDKIISGVSTYVWGDYGSDYTSVTNGAISILSIGLNKSTTMQALGIRFLNASGEFYLQAGTAVVGSFIANLPNKSGTLAMLSDFPQVVEVSGTSQNMAINTTYIAHNVALTTFTLPTTNPNIGSLITILGEGAGGFRISQNASQFIVSGNASTTVGTGGYIQTSTNNTSITLRYVNTNKWMVTSSNASPTIV